MVNVSKAQQLVLRELARGSTYEEIATRLWLSVNTVKSHVRAIYRAYDVHSRVELLEKVRTRATVG